MAVTHKRNQQAWWSRWVSPGTARVASEVGDDGMSAQYELCMTEYELCLHLRRPSHAKPASVAWACRLTMCCKESLEKTTVTVEQALRFTDGFLCAKCVVAAERAEREAGGHAAESAQRAIEEPGR